MKFAIRFLFLVTFSTLFAVQFGSFVRAQEEDEEPDKNVRFDLATTARLGIVTAPLHAADFHAETRGFGVVMPFDTLVQADADLATAEAAVEASKAALAASKTALERARGLFSANVSVSRQTVETADRQVTADERQMAADVAQLTLAERKAVAAWGGQDLPWRNAAERTALVAQLTSGNVALVRVTFPTGAMGGGANPATLKVDRVGAEQSAAGWTSTRIWNAPGDPTVPGRSYFALVERARGLLPGERLIVTIPVGRTQQGVIIPSAAVLIAEGMGWYYDRETVMPVIPLAPFYIFNRRMLDLSQPTPEGYFVAGIDPKTLVVVEGAGLILARETGSTEEEE
jgi:hypothetical protein